MTEQIGCEGEDARFMPCSTCLHNGNIQRCYKIREEGNLKVVVR